MPRHTSSGAPVIHQARDSSVSSSFTRSSGTLSASSSSPSSSYSGSSGSTPRSFRATPPTEAREYGASGHSMTMSKRNNVVVINRHEAGYDRNAPQPTYNSGYAGKKKGHR
ncbi:hypothetical protein ACRALDRAFT_1062651 [Sodiomyces alcalophilus JCM 7366]|uniref:uncharacterized protein n=1 Tax=Sodiomyces alcalophilus JCM 7366 TaxID=591952 RepID=UPI0039B50407